MALKKSFSNRRFIIVAIFLAISIIYIVRLFFIQIIDEQYKSSADKNARRYITEYPARGLIYDRNGKLLVFNEVTYDLMVIPMQVESSLDTLGLCSLINMDLELFRKKMRAAATYSSYLPTIIEEKLPKETYGMIQEQLVSYPGFYVQARTIRNYPQPVASHILGYIGEVTPEQLSEDAYYKTGDYIGISGLEKSYESVLRGNKGIRIIMVDVHGRDKGSYKNGKEDVEAKAGKDLFTSIDIDLQTFGEELMQNKRGSIVAIEPATGEILAMVSSPTYDPGMLVGRDRAKNYFTLIMDKNLPLFNRAITGKYPPGSTFKPVVGLVAEQEGVLTGDMRYPCFSGFPLGNGKSVACHSHPSPLNLIGAIQYSCNAYFCKVFKTTLENKAYSSSRAGFNEWRKMVMKFGLGQKTGVDIPNESSGNIPSSEYYDKVFGQNHWRALSVISLAIGQGEIQLTPLQLANVTCIIANQGHYITPHLVRAIGTKSSLNPRFREDHNTGISAQYFEPVIEGMYAVVQSGTAYNVRMDSISICGKTGTAQNAGKNHSIFIAFAPKDHPRIAIAAVVENSGFGATWAAPISSLMIEYYLTRKVKRLEMQQNIMDGKTIE
jgi:penicillin-binding protein 2